MLAEGWTRSSIQATPLAFRFEGRAVRLRFRLARTRAPRKPGAAKLPKRDMIVRTSYASQSAAFDRI
jgi:hypothetical protein